MSMSASSSENKPIRNPETVLVEARQFRQPFAKAGPDQRVRDQFSGFIFGQDRERYQRYPMPDGLLAEPCQRVTDGVGFS